MNGVSYSLSIDPADSSPAIGLWIPILVKEMHGGAWANRLCKGSYFTSHDSSTSGKQRNNPILPPPQALLIKAQSGPQEHTFPLPGKIPL